MPADIIDLRDFYTTSLGHTTRALIQRRIRHLWPCLERLSLAGYGYATPYLRCLSEKTARHFALMPEKQGVFRWPLRGANQVALTETSSWPLPDCSIDRLLMIHAIEFAEPPRATMREAWRVLSDSGRLLMIVANRRSLWARLDSTPFGWGQPYSQRQLANLLRDSLFTPTQTGYALFMPPLTSRVIRAAAPFWEEIGQRWLGQFSGVILMEAAKQIYAPSTSRPYSQPTLAGNRLNKPLTPIQG